MKIHVSRVPEGGLRDTARLDPSGLDMERDDIHLREPFDVEAMSTKSGRELVVQVDIRCPLQLTCARCLEEFTQVVTPTGYLHYTVSPADVVDITDDVRQEIILAYPIIPLCKSECKGLCATCGAKLNTERCRHHAATPPDASS